MAIFQRMGGEGVAAADRFADAVEEPWLWRTGLVGLADGERRDIRDVHHCRTPHRAGQLKGEHACVPPPVAYHDSPSVRARQYGISRDRPHQAVLREKPHAGKRGGRARSAGLEAPGMTGRRPGPDGTRRARGEQRRGRS